MEAPAIFKRAAERVLGSDLAALTQAVIASEASMRDLRAQIRNQGWKQLGGEAEKSTFSRSELKTIVNLCRAAALKNPLIIRGLAVRREYVFGQGVSIEPEREADQKLLDAFMEDKRNRRQLVGPQGFSYAQTELDATGNIFTACIASDRRGRMLPVPQVRTIPFEQITDLVCNPDDAEDVWFYKRERTARSFDPRALDGVGAEREVAEWHPSLEYWRQTQGRSSDRIPDIGGKPVVWNAPLAHRRHGGFNHWTYGLPIVYAALDWAQAHTRYLSNWDNFVSALAQVAVTMTKKGATQDQLTAMQTKLESSMVDGGLSGETNPAPVSGSTMVLSDKVKLEAFRASGMAPDISDSKGFRLQIAAALGIPEHFLSGDADQGSRATARTLDRPTELAIMAEQEGWIDYLEDIATWAVESQKRNASGNTQVSVTFPPILEHDPLEYSEAVSKAVSTPISGDLAGAEREIRKALLEGAGVADVDAILDAAEFEPGSAEPQEPPQPGMPDPNAAQAGEAVATRYARRIIEEVRKLQAEAA